MAHECPDCGQTCYCRGDIDDCDFGLQPPGGCDHCPGEWEDGDGDLEWEELEDEEEFEGLRVCRPREDSDE